MRDSWKKLTVLTPSGKKAKINHRKAKKYKAMKYNGDDMYSWAVFYQKDVCGFSPPIFEDMGITPIIAGCGREEAKHYIKQLEKRDAESIISTGKSI